MENPLIRFSKKLKSRLELKSQQRERKHNQLEITFSNRFSIETQAQLRAVNKRRMSDSKDGGN